MNSVECSEKPTFSEFFSSQQALVFVILIVAGLLLRWIGLGDRPLHHDESIHAMFGLYFFDFPEQNYYHYNPEYHGPTIYMMYRLVYNLFGAHDWSARVPMALIGSLALAGPYVFRRYLRPVSVLGLTAAMAFSPTLIFWSRFAREDAYVLLGMYLVLYGALLVKSPYKVIVVLLGITINYMTKANVFVFMALLIGYMIYEAIILFARRDVLVDSDAEVSVFRRAFRQLKLHPAHSVFALLMSATLFSYVITSGFRFKSKFLPDEGAALAITRAFASMFGTESYIATILDGLGRASFLFWLGKHNQERIAGPFLFHVYELSWYELAFMLAVLLQAAIFYYRSNSTVRFVAGLAGLISLAVALPTALGDLKDWPLLAWLGSAFKLKDPAFLEFLGLGLIVSHAFLITTVHLLRRERTLAFFGYFFMANLFTYSYLGEKVPWLSTYPLIAGLIYLTLYFQDYVERYPLTNWQAVRFSDALVWSASFVMLLGILFFIESNLLAARADGERVMAIQWMVIGLIMFLVGLAGNYFKLFGRFNLRNAAFCIVILFNLRIALIVNFFTDGEHELGYISQVHTTKQFRDVANDIRETIESERYGYRPQVYVTGEPTWPVTWYFRGMSEYKFNVSTDGSSDQDFLKAHPDFLKENFGYVLETWEDSKPVPDGFVSRKLNLRGWWVPDFGQMTLYKFLNNSLNLRPWSAVGFSYTRLLVNKKLLPQQLELAK